MQAASGRLRFAAVSGASVLGAFVLTAVVVAGAGTASAAPTGLAAPLSKVSASLHGGQESQALQNKTNTQLGAVTFVNNDLGGPSVVDVAVSEGSTQIGTLTLGAGTVTNPQLLPAGSYHVAVTAAGSASAVASGTLMVTTGTDTSEVLYNSAGRGAAPAGGLASFTDAVRSVPAGRTTVSVRNLSPTAGAVDVFVDGTKVASDLAPGMSSEMTVSAGDENVVVVPTGTEPSGATPLFSGSFAAQQDSYVPLYLVDDASQTSGVGADTTAFLQGYQYTASDGGVFDFGSFPFLGSTGNIKLNQPMVGGAEATDDAGYWLVASDGGVFTFGNVPFLGSLGDLKLNAPITGIAATVGPDGEPGYLLVARDGGVFAFNAGFYGSLGGQAIASPVVGIAADPATGSYTLAEANGTWFTFGPGQPDKPVSGSVAPNLNKPIVGIADTADGGGSWLVASDGGVFTVGDAPFEGSTGNLHLNQPINSIFPSFDGLGYNLIAGDGGVFSFGDANFFGSTGNIMLNEPVVGAVNI